MRIIIPSLSISESQASPYPSWSVSIWSGLDREGQLSHASPNLSSSFPMCSWSGFTTNSQLSWKSNYLFLNIGYVLRERWFFHGQSTFTYFLSNLFLYSCDRDYENEKKVFSLIWTVYILYMSCYLKFWEQQAGFREDRSCIDQKATLRIIKEKSLEWNTSLLINFVDFGKAFDSLDTETLWNMMAHYGTPQSFISIIKNSYNNMIFGQNWSSTRMPAITFSCPLGNRLHHERSNWRENKGNPMDNLATTRRLGFCGRYSPYIQFTTNASKSKNQQNQLHL